MQMPGKDLIWGRMSSGFA